MTKKYEKAIVKFNNGEAELLCNKCNRIIGIGFVHEDREHYCGEPNPYKTYDEVMEFLKLVVTKERYNRAVSEETKQAIRRKLYGNRR